MPEHEFITRYLQAKPNAAHYALASLGDPSILSRIAPSLGESATPPLLITQHIDSLSLRALDALPAEAKVAAEKRLLEMHGSIFVTRCTSCQHTLRSHDTPLASALIDPERHDIPVAELRRCGGEKWSGSNRYGKCGGLLRPSVTWFGEVSEHMGEIARQLNWCDMLLVVGTSFTVSVFMAWTRIADQNSMFEGTTRLQIRFDCQVTRW